MSTIPTHLRYTKDHEWLLPVGDGAALVGITDHAQASLGDIVFIELPKVGAHFAAGASFGVVESVKAASDLFMPIAAEVVAINPALESQPELVNQAPYTEGWMIKVRLADPKSVTELLDAAAYEKLI